MEPMKFLKYLSAFAVAAALAGCSLFPTGPALPENSPRLIAYQLGDEPELLVIPVCDRDGSLAIAAPRILRAPYRDILRLNDECGSVWRRKRQPSRLLMLTPDGTLWSALPVETPEPALVFFRSTLDEAGKAQLLDELKTREFELAAPDSAWLAPGTAELNAPVAVEPLDGDANWDAAVRFVEAAEAPGPAGPFEPFDRAAGRHGVYCSAQKSHVKPDYPPNAVLTLEYAKDKPVRIGSRAEFSDPGELYKALSIHLASGSYALVKLKLSALEDVFPLERSGIGALVRERALHYGSDHVVEMPDQTTVWYCSRCLSAE